jgi:alginate O-acetyltransferase complex protein AlgI
MLFVTYWFVAFAGVFFPIYWVARNALVRRLLLIAFGAAFYLHFAGPEGVAPIVILGAATYAAARWGSRTTQLAAIGASVLALVFYKYTLFATRDILGSINPQWGALAADVAQSSFLPATPPLAISFFVFEFVHYLTDVRSGGRPIRSPLDFALFSLFWPSVVAGPIKRYQQFLPALAAGAVTVTTTDLKAGSLRIVFGLLKKFAADYLSQIILVGQGQFVDLSLRLRWEIVVAIALRILFDFSGYSDMAIGFARLMGIRLPENFNWPYLATSVGDFWRRWHISLSTWIRDYVYIPLGGSRHGPLRKAGNALVAFALCGLWHGAG